MGRGWRASGIGSLKDDGHPTNIVGIRVNQMVARKPPVPQVMRYVGKEMAKCIHTTTKAALRYL